MSKRVKRPKRRDRRLGESPYHKYHKTPYRYSSAYTSWRSRFATRKEVER